MDYLRSIASKLPVAYLSGFALYKDGQGVQKSMGIMELQMDKIERTPVTPRIILHELKLINSKTRISLPELHDMILSAMACAVVTEDRLWLKTCTKCVDILNHIIAGSKGVVHMQAKKVQFLALRTAVQLWISAERRQLQDCFKMLSKSSDPYGILRAVADCSGKNVAPMHEEFSTYIWDGR